MGTIDWLDLRGNLDPPHLGHLKCKKLLDSFSIGAVICLPSFSPPIAGDGLKVTSASFQNRLEMTELMFASSR